jgi:hypothetical protein
VQKPARFGASRSPSVDRASRGNKWGRRRGEPALARGKQQNEGRRRVMPFYGGSAARRGGKGQGVRLGAAWGQERRGEGGAGVRRCVSQHNTDAAALGRSDSDGRA